MGKLLLTVVLIILLFDSAESQQRTTLNQYMSEFKDVAMDEMRAYGIPASIKLAQGILESGFGNSDLAVQANNHFGIKCHGWQGRTFYKDDDEPDECFRSYNDPKQSWRDHSEFLKNRERYESLFNLRPDDYRGWARGLQRAGYATNPNYSRLLIRIIEENDLQRFDRQVLAESRTADRRGRDDTRKPVVVADPDNFTPVALNREVHLNNRVRYIIALPGDTPEKIAKEFEMREWQISRYNEFENGGMIEQGDKVYLQPKKRRGEIGTHVVSPGESMYDVSQKYAIRLKYLYRRNNMEPGEEPNPGDTLKLRRR